VLEAMRATGVLRELNERGILHVADVHVAARLGVLAGELDERAQLALALAVRGVRHGSVVLDLSAVGRIVAEDGSEISWPDLAGWRSALDTSPLLDGPLRREGDKLWLDSYWRQEVFVAEDLLRRASLPGTVDQSLLGVALARLWSGGEPDDQRAAAATCALSNVAVLGGGPGTGKTTTVARLLVALQEASPDPLRIALAAPTARAASRLGQSMVREAFLAPHERVLTEDELAFLRTLEPQTLHRLLGVRRGSAQFWHHAGRRLPHDVVVVDEASMVSLTMFAKLLEALRPEARPVLVGDPEQLASIEAGAILSDLVAGGATRTVARVAALASVVPLDMVEGNEAESPGARLRDGTAFLHRVRRFDESGAIDALAKAIQSGRAPNVLDVLRSGAEGVRFDEVRDDQPVPPALLRGLAVKQALDIVDHAVAGRHEEALLALGEHRLLCGHREGPRGVNHWSRLIHGWLVHDLALEPRRDGRYDGQPLLVQSNDYDNKLWNGDVGIVVEDAAVFPDGAGVRTVPLGRLGDVRPMYAMTAHRAQGSQFPSVTVLLPPASSPLGTRETLYTAVTRAETHLQIIGSAEAVAAAVGNRVQRASGLPERLA